MTFRLLSVAKARHGLVEHGVISRGELLLLGRPESGLEGLQHGARHVVGGSMGLALDVSTFMAMLLKGLELSLVPRQAPHLGLGLGLDLGLGLGLDLDLGMSLGGLSVNLHRSGRLSFCAPHLHTSHIVAPFMERHLTPDSTRIGSKVWAPSWDRGLLRPAGALYGVLVNPLHWGSLLIVEATLGPFVWVVNPNAATRIIMI